MLLTERYKEQIINCLANMYLRLCSFALSIKRTFVNNVNLKMTV
jgi:hypothetical protein